MFNDVERRKGNMKTNELEKEIGLSKYTIRYYEKEGLIQPKREENGYRDYIMVRNELLKASPVACKKTG